MRMRWIGLVLFLAIGLGGCSEEPAAPDATTAENRVMMQRQGQGPPGGTGLLLESITGLSVPLIGQVGEVTIDQAIITDLAIVENVVGQIIGIEAEGILQLTGGVLGTDVITEDFMTTVMITSTGPGQCELITIDVGQVQIDALVVSIDVPEASVTGRGSGAVGSLLCNLGNLLSGLIGGGGIIPGVGGIVNALNNQI